MQTNIADNGKLECFQEWWDVLSVDPRALQGTIRSLQQQQQEYKQTNLVGGGEEINLHNPWNVLRVNNNIEVRQKLMLTKMRVLFAVEFWSYLVNSANIATKSLSKTAWKPILRSDWGCG